MQQREIKAVVFDMDGILVETEEIWSRVRGEVVAAHGGIWTDQDQRNVMGDNSRQWSEYMVTTWQLPLSTEEIFNEVLSTMIATYRRDGLHVLPGARDAVALLHARVPLAVASSSPRALIEATLEISGLRQYFQQIVSSDDVSIGKPAPDVYLKAAESLGYSAAECVAIEDSTNGIRAALAAGLWTIAVPNATYPPAAEALAGAHLVLPSLTQLSLHELPPFAQGEL